MTAADRPGPASTYGPLRDPRRWGVLAWQARERGDATFVRGLDGPSLTFGQPSADADRVAGFLHGLGDAFVKGGRVREDGRMMHDMLPTQVKSPAESKGDRDVSKVLATIPADEAVRPFPEGECPLPQLTRAGDAP